MKKLFCEIGVLLGCFLLLLATLSLAYAVVPVFVCLWVSVCAAFMMRACWVALLRLEAAERRARRRRSALRVVSSVQRPYAA